MEFADGVVKAAWDRQGGRCAKCGRWLIWAQRGRESMTGAWQPHHKNPDDHDGGNSLANCIIFCSGLADCHFNEGHGGISWSHHACLDDSGLLFLDAGEADADRTPAAATGQKGSLIAAFLGISRSPAKKAGGRPKQKARRTHRRRAGAEGKKAVADGLGAASDL